MLRICLPQNVRRVLHEQPPSMDETYERMLREISKSDTNLAYLLLQFLTVANRPLRVDELAEILALDFYGREDVIPELNANWRWEDKRKAVLATCSSLIVVVEGYVDLDYSKTSVVQFAHSSVKEFLTSDRLANLKEDISRFHIRLEPAHTIIARSCLAILLHPDHDDGAETTSPLSQYAARYWVDHAHFGNVSLIEHGIRRRFDPAKSYLTAWLNSYDPDIEWTSFLRDDSHSFPSSPRRSKFTSLGEDDAPLCLYYTALCGFYNLTRYLITMYPQHVNATVGLNKSPLVAALCNGHVQVAELLHLHGAVLPIGYNGRTLLHAASADGLADVAQWLLDIGADANAQVDGRRTPLYFAAMNGHLEPVQILLSHGVDVDTVLTDNYTLLHKASSGGHTRLVQLLIEHGVDVHVRDESQLTPLHLASSRGNDETVQLLIKHGADVHTRDESQSTLLHLASSRGNDETVQLLIEHGADVHARDEIQSTPLHLASSWGNSAIVRLLIENGADVHVRDESQLTPLLYAKNSETMQLLIEYGADIHARDESQSTPLHLASASSRVNAIIVQLLIENGADVHARDESQLTPLHCAKNAETMQLLIKYGADIHARDESQSTPLHLASSRVDAETVQLLIKNGAHVNARDEHQSTPLHCALSGKRDIITRLAIDHGENATAKTIQVLIENGADVIARDTSQSTPLHLASSSWDVNITQLLINHGADVRAENQDQSTPLHIASSLSFSMNMGTTVRVLIEHGARVNAYDKNHRTPLHRVSSCWDPNPDSLRLLLENGADVDAEDNKGLTAFQIASSQENWQHDKITQLLFDHHASMI